METVSEALLEEAEQLEDLLSSVGILPATLDAETREQLEEVAEASCSLRVPDGSLESALLATTLTLFNLKEVLERRRHLSEQAVILEAIAHDLREKHIRAKAALRLADEISMRSAAEVQQLIEGMSDLSAELPRLKEETRERRAALEAAGLRPELRCSALSVVATEAADMRRRNEPIAVQLKYFMCEHPTLTPTGPTSRVPRDLPASRPLAEAALAEKRRQLERVQRDIEDILS